MYIYFYSMNHKIMIVNFPKKISLKIDSILSRDILHSGVDIITDKPRIIRFQCGVRIGALCIVVPFFQFMQ